MKKIIFIALLILSSLAGFSQDTTSSKGKVTPVSTSEVVEMADQFRQDGKIYVVIAVAFVILIGIFIYIILLNRKLNTLEKELKIK